MGDLSSGPGTHHVGRWISSPEENPNILQIFLYGQIPPNNRRVPMSRQRVLPPGYESRVNAAHPATRAYRHAVIRKRVLVSGDVQGVFFRDTCRRIALQRGVAGWVRNLPDQRVEAVFEGPPEPVQSLVEWAGQGPREATVAHVDIRDEPPEGLSGFSVRPTPAELR
jgi:acylphosphatase